jgi:hypothetical protein
MNPSLLQRQAALGGVAMLAVLGALALGRNEEAVPSGTEGSVPPSAQWRTAAVGVSRGRGAACGQPVGRETVGVVHPVLPCGAKLVVQGTGEPVRTEVVGRGAVGLEHEFDLTPRLASRVGVEGSGRIRWRFAS